MPPIRLALEAAVGVAHRDGTSEPVTLGVGLDLSVALTRVAHPSSFELGIAARYQSHPDPVEDLDDRGLDDVDEPNFESLDLIFGPRFYLATEPARREGFRFSLGGGLRAPLGTVGEFGPIAEFTVERQAGTLRVQSSLEGRLPRHGTGQNITLGLRGQVGFGPLSDYRALTLVASYAHEFGVRLPEPEPQRRRRPDVEYVLALEAAFGSILSDKYSLGGGGAVGLGFSLGQILPFLPASFGELRFRAALDRFSGQNREPDNRLTFAGGIRVPRWWFLALELSTGYATSIGSDPDGIPEGAFVEIGAGMHWPNMLGCGVGISSTVRTQIAVDDDEDRSSVLMHLGIEYDNLIRAAECQP